MHPSPNLLIVAAIVIGCGPAAVNHNTLPPASASAPATPTSHQAAPSGPMVGVPVTPGTSNVDLRTLPTAKPWKPGDPIYEQRDGRFSGQCCASPGSCGELAFSCKPPTRCVTRAEQHVGRCQ